MAVDTAAKRMSALNVGRGILLPKPDGSIDSSDRQTLSNLYSGIPADPPVAAIAGQAVRWTRTRRQAPMPWMRTIDLWPEIRPIAISYIASFFGLANVRFKDV